MNTHRPVLLRETLEYLRASAGRVFWDGTFGGGGHTRAILEANHANVVHAIDRDPAAVPRAAALAATFPNRLHFTSANYAEPAAFSGEPFDGALIDAGVSSFQLDTPERGFSLRTDAPADMRMNPDEGISVAEFLETAPLTRIGEVIRDYGEEPRWKAVVRAIENARGTGALSRTGSLAALIERATSRPGPPQRIHPATRTFQGLRIAINGEIDSLRAALPRAFAALKPGGILAVISFHSLEDREVKRYFNEIAGRPVSRTDNRTQDARHAVAELLTRHPCTPSDAEIAENPRSRSSRLRAVRKLSDAEIASNTPAARFGDVAPPFLTHNNHL